MLHELIENREVQPIDGDRTLVRACRQGDQDAWEIMLQTHSKRILNLCLRYAGRREEAEDLTQEVFVRIYRSLRSFRLDSGSFQCWIVSVARNLSSIITAGRGGTRPRLAARKWKPFTSKMKRPPAPRGHLKAPKPPGSCPRRSMV